MAVHPAETPKLVTVAEGFHVRQAIDNMAWIDLGEWALVVDALEQPHLEREVFEAIHSTLGDEPVRYLLNTHTHGDHIALNRAFQRRCGTEIINQRTTSIPPEGRWFEGSRRRAQMLPMPGLHSGEDCIIWVPDDRALFTGDLFGWGIIPLMRGLSNDSIKAVLDSYARMIAFGAAVVIPGHGPLATTAELQRFVDYVGWLCEEVSRACGETKSDRQILSELTPPDDMTSWWRFLAWKHEDSLGKVLRAIRSGSLTTERP
jgi:glyoxylase-like metal-dependent hydrolase (beta-lactamase superfamily II)